jgi:hypothetical protein
MSIEYITAQDEIFGVANAAWIAAAEAQSLTYTPAMFFPGDEQLEPPVDQIYSEVNYANVKSSQASLSNWNSISVYEDLALFTLKVYCPKSAVTAYRTATVLADAVRNAFRKKSPSGEIWFRNQRVAPADGNATQGQINVVVTCVFRTLK